MSLEMALAIHDKDTFGRIAQGDVSLGSIFTQMHAAQIILAVQQDYVRVVERNGKQFLYVTILGRVHFGIGVKSPEAMAPVPTEV